METEDAVMRIPGRVQHQPNVSMTEDGHSTYAKFTPLSLRAPSTPAQRKTSTMLDTVNPTMPPIVATCLLVTSNLRISDQKQFPGSGPLYRGSRAAMGCFCRQSQASGILNWRVAHPCVLCKGG